MPFKSKSQQRFMFATHPKMARRWAHETPDIKALPEKVEKKASMLTLSQVALAMNAFENTKIGHPMDLKKVSLASFYDELEKIAVDAATMLRVAEKAGKRGWSGARETKSLMRLMKHEGRAGSKILNPQAFEGGLTKTHISPPRGSGTVNQRVPAGARPGPPVPSQVAPAPQRPQSNLRRNLAIGGAVGSAGLLGHMMPQHQQQQQAHY